MQKEIGTKPRISAYGRSNLESIKQSLGAHGITSSFDLFVTTDVYIQINSCINNKLLGLKILITL